MASAVYPATVGRGQLPQTLPPTGANDKRGEKEYPNSEAYDEEKYKGSDDASMLAEAHTPDLQAIMARIQTLASTVASIQLASRRQQMGRQTKRRSR